MAEKPEVLTVLTDTVVFTGAINPEGVETFIMTLKSVVSDDRGQLEQVVAFRAGMTRRSLMLLLEAGNGILEGGTPPTAARN